MECTICFEDFSRCVPRMLDCGHTFCESCLDWLCKRHTQTVECPNCREPHKVKKTGQLRSELKRNYALEELLVRQSSDGKSTKSSAAPSLLIESDSTRCDNCTQVATMYCAGCALSVCAACLASIHEKLPPVILKKHSRLHTPIPLQHTSSNHTCSAHQKPVSHFCATDNSLLCVECVSSHPTHDVSTIIGSANRCRLSLQQTISATRKSLEPAQQAHQNRTAAVNACQKASSVLKATINDQFNTIQNQLQAQQKKLLDSLENCTQERVSLLNNEIKQLQQVLDSAEYAISFASSVTAPLKTPSSTPTGTADTAAQTTDTCIDLIKNVAPAATQAIDNVASHLMALSMNSPSMFTPLSSEVKSPSSSSAKPSSANLPEVTKFYTNFTQIMPQLLELVSQLNLGSTPAHEQMTSSSSSSSSSSWSGSYHSASKTKPKIPPAPPIPHHEEENMLENMGFSLFD